MATAEYSSTDLEMNMADWQIVAAVLTADGCGSLAILDKAIDHLLDGLHQ